MPNIVVLGAGVSGLTSALLLAKWNKANSVTIVAKHMPGDYEAEYTSPWAGANVLPFAIASPDAPTGSLLTGRRMSTDTNSRWERRTWPELARLAREVPNAGIHFQKCRVLRRKVDMPDEHLDAVKNPLSEALFDEKPWYEDLMPDFRQLDASELSEGIQGGCEFTSVCINTAIYLPWLVGQCLALGVVIKRATISHVSEAASLHHSGNKADVVVNCSGLLACRLGGVMDAKVVPGRGQIVLVRNSAKGVMTTTSGTDDGPEELLYIMERAAGGGTILGGTYQKGNWDPMPDHNIAMRIMKRAVDFCPELTGGKGVEGLDIIKHGVGFRPVREGGVRLEPEDIGGVKIVHNYGHAGWGYQGSYGCAEKVVSLVNDL